MANAESDLDAIDSLIDKDEAATDAAKIQAFGNAPPETPAQADEKKSRKQAALDRKAAADAERAASEERFTRLESSIDMSAQQIHMLREENARLSGALSQRQAPVVQVPQGPSAEDLYRQAAKSLDDKDMTEYHRLMREASRADAAAIAQERVNELRQHIPDPRQFQQQQQPAADMGFQIALANNLGRTPRLSALPQEQWQARINAECGVLQAEGHAPGPALLAKAFDNCESRISGKATRATFQRGNGIPVDRHVNGSDADSGGDDAGTDAQRAMWKRAGLPEAEFKKYA